MVRRQQAVWGQKEPCLSYFAFPSVGGCFGTHLVFLEEKKKKKVRLSLKKSVNKNHSQIMYL